MSSRSIPVVVSGRTSCLVLAEQYSYIYSHHTSFNHSSTEKDLGYSQLLATVAHAATNMGGQSSLRDPSSTPSGCKPRSGTAGSYGCSIFNFPGKPRNVFHGSGTNLHPQQQRTRAPLSPGPHGNDLCDKNHRTAGEGVAGALEMKWLFCFGKNLHGCSEPPPPGVRTPRSRACAPAPGRAGLRGAQGIGLSITISRGPGHRSRTTCDPRGVGQSLRTPQFPGEKRSKNGKTPA